MISTTVRGNVVLFEANPLDAMGNPTTPASVTAYVVYYINGVSHNATVPMSLSGSTWTGLWDSTPAQSGTVFWSIRALSPDAAQDGQFQLTANPANM